MMDSFQIPLSHTAGSSTPATDPELENKVKKGSEKISENLHIFANEPSLACYRLQEHIRKSLPHLVLKRIEVTQLHKDLQGKCYDLEYSIGAVKLVQNSHEHFQNTFELIQQAVRMKQLLNKEEAKKTDKKKISMYQRFSGSFDLPTSILPSITSGLSASASVSSDLKSSPAQPLKTASASSSPRRSRASSVSSVPSRATLTRQHSASCSPTPKKSGHF